MVPQNQLISLVAFLFLFFRDSTFVHFLHLCVIFRKVFTEKINIEPCRYTNLFQLLVKLIFDSRRFEKNFLTQYITSKKGSHDKKLQKDKIFAKWKYYMISIGRNDQVVCIVIFGNLNVFFYSFLSGSNNQTHW